MELKKLGKIYKLNSNDEINNIKDTETEVESSGILSHIINSVFCILNCQPRSVYLRGSLIDKSLSDNTVEDLDLVFVYDNTDYFDFFGTRKYESMMYVDYSYDENKIVFPDVRRTIQDEIYEMIGLHIDLDISIKSEKLFTEVTYINKFQSKKIYGEGQDLSVSNLSKDILLLKEEQTLLRRKKLCLKKISKSKKFLYKEMTYEGNIRERMIKSVLKVFFREYSFDILLRKNSFSRDIYYCYTSIVGEYPDHSNHLEELLDLFLNTKSYTDREVIDLLNKLEYLINEIELLIGNQYKTV